MNLLTDMDEFVAEHRRCGVHWLRLLVLMWLLIRIDDNWELVIIGGYDTEQNCRLEEERSLWGSRVFCAPTKTRTTLS